jgi:integrase
MTMTYGLGTIEPRRGRFRLRLPDGRGGYQDGGSFATWEEADQVRRGAVALRRAGELATGRTTLRSYGERWLDRRELKGARDMKNPRNRWKNHVATAPFADWSIEAIRPKHVAAWIEDLTAKMANDKRKKRRISAWTVHHCVALLRRCLERARIEGLIDDNPAKGHELPPIDHDDGWTYLTLEEQKRLLGCAAIPPTDRLILAFAIGTGLRQGEQWTLELGDVHLDDPQPWIWIRWGGFRKGQRQPPKNGRPRRVLLFGLALEALRAWLRQLPAYSRRETSRNPFGLVFPTQRGCRRRDGKPLRAWSAYLKAAGLDRPELRHDGRKVRHHDMRHTCASALVSGMWGGPAARWRLEDVREQLGHKSIVTTQRYAHLAPSALAPLAAVTILDLPQISPSFGHVVAETPCFTGRATLDSNQWPSAPEADALSS